MCVLEINTTIIRKPFNRPSNKIINKQCITNGKKSSFLAIFKVFVIFSFRSEMLCGILYGICIMNEDQLKGLITRNEQMKYLDKRTLNMHRRNNENNKMLL